LLALLAAVAELVVAIMEQMDQLEAQYQLKEILVEQV
jgi:hypothetical protein